MPKPEPIKQLEQSIPEPLLLLKQSITENWPHVEWKRPWIGRMKKFWYAELESGTLEHLLTEASDGLAGYEKKSYKDYPAAFRQWVNNAKKWNAQRPIQLSSYRRPQRVEARDRDAFKEVNGKQREW